MASVSISKGGIELGTGTATNGSAEVTSYTATASRVTGQGRNVEVTASGKTMSTRVLTDASTLIMKDTWPFAS